MVLSRKANLKDYKFWLQEDDNDARHTSLLWREGWVLEQTVLVVCLHSMVSHLRTNEKLEFDALAPRAGTSQWPCWKENQNPEQIHPALSLVLRYSCYLLIDNFLLSFLSFQNSHLADVGPLNFLLHIFLVFCSFPSLFCSAFWDISDFKFL